MVKIKKIINRWKKPIVLATSFMAVSPLIYALILDMPKRYWVTKFSRVHECLLGLYPIVSDPMQCSEMSRMILVRDFIFFALYPVVLSLFILFVILGLKKLVES